VPALAVLCCVLVLACNVYFWSHYMVALTWAIVTSALVRPAAIAWGAWAHAVSRGEARVETSHGLAELVLVHYPPFFLAMAIAVVLLPLEVSLALVPACVFLAPVGWRVLVSSGVVARVLGFFAEPGRAAALILWVSLLCALWIVVGMSVASGFEAAELALEASRELSSLLDDGAALTERRAAWLHERFGASDWWPFVGAVLESIAAQESSAALMDRLSLALQAQHNGTEWEWFVEQAVKLRRREAPRALEVLGKLAKLPSEVFASAAMLAWSLARIAGHVALQVHTVAGQLLASVFLLHKLVGLRHDAFALICRLGLSAEEAETLADRLRRGLAQAFSPVFSASRNALLVLVVFTALGRRCAFIAALLVFVLGLTSLVPPKEALVLVALPWTLVPPVRLFLHDGGGGVSASALVDVAVGGALPFALLRASKLASEPAAAKPIVSAWLMDFSVGVGLSHFGFNGLLLGPTLVSVTVVLAGFFFDDAADAGAALDEATASPFRGGTPNMTTTPLFKGQLAASATGTGGERIRRKVNL